MDVRVQADKAEQFRRMHAGPRILALPNAWDAVSARILEEAGHPAIATSSAAGAFFFGYPRGQRISRTGMLQTGARSAPPLPVSLTAAKELGDRPPMQQIIDTPQDKL